MQKVEWKGREAVALSNGRLRAVLLAGGGHMAEVRLLREGQPSVNLLWEAPWQTADPGTQVAGRLGELYGGMPAGPFLAGFTGHALCLDTFGPPSPEQETRGIPLHGEASMRTWTFALASDGCVAQAEMPRSQLQITRSIAFAGNQSALFIEEELRNESDAAREVHWVQHVSLGAPLLAPGCSSIQASADRCKSWPAGYEGREALRADTDFAWPWAPAVDGGKRDLRIPFQERGKGFLAAARVAQEIACVAAINFSLGLALIYCFRREDFPWIAVWEENRARKYPPWNGTTQVRGMEFGTTPMPLGKDGIGSMGPLLGAPVERVMSPGSSLTARYVVCAAEIPKGRHAVEAVHAVNEDVVFSGAETGGQITVTVEGMEEFLHKESL